MLQGGKKCLNCIILNFEEEFVLKKLFKIIASVSMSLLMAGTIVPAAFAAEVNPITASPASQAQVNKVNLPNLDSMKTLTRGQQLKLNPAEDQFFKIDLNGTTYIVEYKKPAIVSSSSPVKVNSSLTGASSLISPLSVQNGYYSQDINIYSNVGILQGTLVEKQSWQYNNGTFTYVPSATATPTVPLYSWPNYWSNLWISAPSYNSSNGEYTSSIQEDLNLAVPTPIGAVTFQSLTCYVGIHFNAYGSAYGTAYWN